MHTDTNKPLRAKLRSRLLLTACGCALSALSCQVRAYDWVYWNEPGGGSFLDPSKWSLNAPWNPGGVDPEAVVGALRFDLGSVQPYVITLGRDATVQHLALDNDHVLLDLQGFTLTAEPASPEWHTVYVGVWEGDQADMTLRNGTLDSVGIAISAAWPDCNGILRVQQGGAVRLRDYAAVFIGAGDSASSVANTSVGTLAVTGGGSVSDDDAVSPYGVWAGGSPASGNHGIGHIIVDGPGSQLRTQGSIHLGTGYGGQGDLVILNGGHVRTDSSVYVGPSSVGWTAALAPSGHVLVAGPDSILDAAGGVIVGLAAEGMLELDGGQVLGSAHAYDYGTVLGAGSISGELVVWSGGVLDPAMAGLQSGSLALHEGSRTIIELSGGLSGQFDHLVVTGQAGLGGELVLRFLDGYAPAAGTTFDLVKAGALSGGFSAVTFAGAGAESFSFSQTATALTLISLGGGSTGTLVQWNPSIFSGEWATASNWVPQQAPTGADDVVIAGPAMVLVGGGTGSAKTLALAGASLTVGNGAELAVANTLSIGLQGGGTSRLTLAGDLSVGGTTEVGLGAYGDVRVLEGATMTTASLLIGNGAPGLLRVDGGSVSVSGAGDVLLGVNGGHGALAVSGGGAAFAALAARVRILSGTVDVQAGGSMSCAGLSATGGASGTASVTISGMYTSLEVDGSIEVGKGGRGELRVLDGAGLGTAGWLEVGNGGDGTMEVTGGTVLTNGLMAVGGLEGGMGWLTVGGGGSITQISGVVLVGAGIGSTGAVLIDGSDDAAGGPRSRFESSAADWIIGDGGTGSVSVAGGALLSARDVRIGGSRGDEIGDGAMEVRGPGSELAAAGWVTVGNGGAGTAQVLDSGRADSGLLAVGLPASAGVLSIRGAGSRWDVAGSAYIGWGSAGAVTVTEGGMLTVGTDLTVGIKWSDVVGAGSLHVGGAGSSVSVGNWMGIGADGVGLLEISDRAAVTVAAGDVHVSINGDGTLKVMSDAALTLHGTETVYIGLGTGAVGQVLVDGMPAETPGPQRARIESATRQWRIGHDGTGFVEVLNAGTVTTRVTEVGVVTGTGELTLSGAGTQWSAVESMTVAAGGSGTVTVGAGASLSVGTSLRVGGAWGANIGDGTMFVQGAGSSVVVGNWMGVGVDGVGRLELADRATAVVEAGDVHVGGGTGGVGALLVSTEAILMLGGAQVVSVGGGTGSTGHVLVDETPAAPPGEQRARIESAGRQWRIGHDGTGTVEVANGGTVSTRVTEVGLVTGTGTLTLSGTGTHWSAVESMTVAGGGTGTVWIHDGAGLNVGTSLRVGGAWGANIGNGSMLVQGADSSVSVGNWLGVGADGVGLLEISDRAAVGVAAGDVHVGVNGDGTLKVLSDATLTLNGTEMVYVGNGASAAGHVLVAGTPAEASGTQSARIESATRQWRIGHDGTGTVQVLNGGVVTTRVTEVGVVTGTGELTLSGAGTQWSAVESMTVAGGGSGMVSVNAGASLTVGTTMRVGGAWGVNIGDGALYVQGPGSSVAVGDWLMVGADGVGLLDVSDGAAVTARQVGIGFPSAGTANIKGGRISVAEFLDIGEEGVLTISPAGTASAGWAVGIFDGGTLNLDHGALHTALVEMYAGTLAGAGTIAARIYAEESVISTPAAADELVLAGPLSGVAGDVLVKDGDGTLTVRASGDYAGLLFVSAGTLRLDGGELAEADVELADGAALTASSGVIGSLGGEGKVDLPAGSSLRAGINGASTTFAGTLTGGGAFIKEGDGELALTRPIALTSSPALLGGAIRFSGAVGAAPAAPSVDVGFGTTLVLDNSAGGNSNRLADTADIILRGGTFAFIGADDTASTETLGRLVLASGGSTVSLTAGAGGTTAVTFSGGLGPRGRGATLNLAALEPGSTNKLLLAGQAPGFMGGWATVNGTDFAKYDGDAGVLPMSGADYTVNVFTPDAHVKLDTAVTNPSVPASVNGVTLKTLNIAASADLSLTQLDNTTLVLSEGGLLKSGAGTATISGGRIRAGINAAGKPSDLYIHASGGSLRLAGQITELAGSGVALVKAGPGILILGDGAADTIPSAYTGPTYLHDGLLILDKADGTLAIPGALDISGGQLVLLRPNQIANDAPVTLSGGVMDLNGRNDVIYDLTVAGGAFRTGSGTLTVLSTNTTRLLAGTTTINAGGTVTTPSLFISGGKNTIEAGGQIIVGAGGTTFSGTQSPSITLNSGDAAGGLLVQSGDITASITQGTASILNGGSAAVPGTVDLDGRECNITVTSSSATLAISARIANGAVRKSGAGSLRLSRANTYAGGTTLAGGTLEVTNAAALGGGDVKFAGGTLAIRIDSASATLPNNLVAAPGAPDSAIKIDFTRPGGSPAEGGIIRQFTVSGMSFGSTFQVQGYDSLAVTGAATLNGDLTIDSTAGITLQGPVTGGGGITKNGSGTLRLSGPADNAYTGPTILTASVLELAKTEGKNAIPAGLTVTGSGTARLLAGHQIADAAPVTINGSTGPALLDLNGFSDSIGSLSLVAAASVSTGAGTLGAGDIAFSGSGGAAHISGRVDLGGIPRTISVANGSAADDLTISAALNAAGFAKTGPGLLRLTGAQQHLPGSLLDVQAGGVRLDSDGGSEAAMNLAIHVAPSASVSLASQQHLSRLEVEGTAGIAPGGANVLWVRELAIGGSGVLDLSGNDLVIRSAAGTGDATLAAVELALGHGLHDSTLSGQPQLGLAAIVNDRGDGQPLLAGLHGESLTADCVLVGLRPLGDTDMSGQVDGDDYFRIDAGFLSQSGGWGGGDFNGDGVVDGADYSALDQTFLRQAIAPSAALAASASAAVPEPSSALAAFAGSILLLRRRRR